MLEQVPAVRAKYHKTSVSSLSMNIKISTLHNMLCSNSFPRPPQHNVMVVADGDQSIYSWRGSSPKYIERFKEDFNPAVIELEEHYRCSENILRAAEAVIANNTRQKETALKTNNAAGHIIYHYVRNTPDAEANLIVTLIRRLVEGRHCSYGHIAILYRRHQLVETLVGRLRQEDIQFQRAGQINSFQEEHAQGILSYLNFIQWQLPRDIEKRLIFRSS